ncbi:transposase [Fusarium langsethiae]|uniref:Transposase n=1 Tax=Fusarium langsethiae TaxID=179993 RepID=A0A0N0V4S3_FUSLA|nr:transposase [Fusarium langsethiae]GKU10124.1 unnamed protein product [Fusarium langsethiae]GKU13813.1 unnamed protein product [Fusarium langsethiae]
MDNSISVRTIKRAISFHYRRKWKSMDRPKLDKEKARIRLHFCQGWIEDIKELKEFINSDEVSVANASSNPNSFCFRMPHEKYNKDLVNKNDHVKPTISVMFWAAIWKTERSRLITMTCDPSSKNNGYSSWKLSHRVRGWYTKY